MAAGGVGQWPDMSQSAMERLGASPMETREGREI
jgi:hypothetical protein